MILRGDRHGAVYVFRAGSLGDAVVFLPAWHAIADRHPDVPLHLITPVARLPGIPDTAAVCGLTGRLGQVIRYDTTRSGLRLVAAAVSKIGPGIVYCQMPERSSLAHLRDYGFLRGVLGLHPIGIGRAIAANLRRGPLQPAYSPSVEWERLLQLAGAVPRPPAFPLLRPGPPAQSRADDVVRGLGGRPFVIACPGSKMPAKRWPVDRFRDVIGSFLARHSDAGMVLLGSPDERPLAAAIAELVPDRIRNLAGELSLEESAALCGRAVCYFGNDTGAMHVAAAMGVRCIGIFSARDYRGKWEPFGTGHTILRSDPPCRGCMLVECTTENLRCLTEVHCRAALDALEACWSTAAETGPRRSSAVSS